MTAVAKASSRSVRALRPDDVPRVCELFAQTFRSGAKPRQAEVAAALAATYLAGPAYDPRRGSIVHVDQQGRVDGFMGIINMTLRLGDRVLQAGVLSAYMADQPAANPTIGARLIRGALQLPLDVVFSDTANSTSLEMARALRFAVLPLQSLEWTKVFRPVGTASYVLSRRRPRLGRWLAAPAGLIDRLLPRLSATEVNDRKLVGTLDRAMTETEFVEAAPPLMDGPVLRTGWESDELAWVLSQAALKTRNGPLHIREVVDRAGRRAGLYLIYARPGGIAAALQVLVRQGDEEMVAGSMLRYARQLGAVAMRGQASPETVRGLLRQRGIIYRNTMSCVAWTADKEIAAALRGGNVCLGGLAGETWTRIFSDAFA